MMAGKRKPVTFTINDRGCHICTSHALGTHGYPCVWKDGRNQNLHRVLYEEACGALPLGILARHTCDDRGCINLNHIIPGTAADNTSDTTMRGRHNPPVGERSGSAKLTIADVAVIRQTKKSQRWLARQYGVQQSTISRIRNGQRWTGEVA